MVTWLLGVVGDVAVILVGAGAGLLLEMLDGIEDLVLSEKKKKTYVNHFHQLNTKLVGEASVVVNVSNSYLLRSQTLSLPPPLPH